MRPLSLRSHDSKIASASQPARIFKASQPTRIFKASQPTRIFKASQNPGFQPPATVHLDSLPGLFFVKLPHSPSLMLQKKVWLCWFTSLLNFQPILNFLQDLLAGDPVKKFANSVNHFHHLFSKVSRIKTAPSNNYTLTFIGKKNMRILLYFVSPCMN